MGSPSGLHPAVLAPLKAVYQNAGDLLGHPESARVPQGYTSDIREHVMLKVKPGLVACTVTRYSSNLIGVTPSGAWGTPGLVHGQSCSTGDETQISHVQGLNSSPLSKSPWPQNRLVFFNGV